MQTIIKAWRDDGTPPTSISPDMHDKLFQPDSSFEGRLSVLERIVRHNASGPVADVVPYPGMSLA